MRKARRPICAIWDENSVLEGVKTGHFGVFWGRVESSTCLKMELELYKADIYGWMDRWIIGDSCLDTISEIDIKMILEDKILSLFIASTKTTFVWNLEST